MSNNSEFLLGKMKEAIDRIDGRISGISIKLDNVEKNQNKLIGGLILVPVLFSVAGVVYAMLT